MKIKIVLLTMLVVLMTGFIGLQLVSAEEDIVDPNIPDSWYQAPKLSSEMNITEFNQSPILDEKAGMGELPPVEERLPEDPIVIEPYNEVGNYGGTVDMWGTDLSQWNFNLYVWRHFMGARPTPDISGIVPSYFKDWEYSNDYKDVTIYLREGVKWSNGDPLTADDILYWWEHEANNEDLNPVPPEKWNPSLVDVTKEDDYTVTYHYGEETPHQILSLRSILGWPPSEFMKQFHPDFIGEEKAQEMAEEVELEHWSDYYSRIKDDSELHPEYEYQRPTLSPFVATERAETYLELERNPYYPFVDTAGNQLPYVDKLRVNKANDAEMAASKAVTGEATYASWHLEQADIPLYMKQAEKSDYRVLFHQTALGNELSLRLNLTSKDSELREIFNDIRFRKALSLAIDRDDINEKLYFGKATPRQATVPPVNEGFEPRFAEAYAEYDPERAEELLDEMGMVDENGDGYRETPDGNTFNPEILFTEHATKPGKILELVMKKFDEIGLNVNIKEVDRGLFENRYGANEIQMAEWSVATTIGPFWHDPTGMQHFAPIHQATHNPWPAYVSWYDTDGEEGMEPPEDIKQIREYAKTILYSTDENKVSEATTKLLESQAENLWTIGTVGMAPNPIIISNKLKNVPEKGLWGWASRFEYTYRPDQFYLED